MSNLRDALTLHHDNDTRTTGDAPTLEKAIDTALNYLK